MSAPPTELVCLLTMVDVRGMYMNLQIQVAAVVNHQTPRCFNNLTNGFPCLLFEISYLASDVCTLKLYNHRDPISCAAIAYNF